MRWQKSRIITALGGAAAMEQTLGFSGIGACADLKGAASTLRHMIENEGIGGFGLVGYSFRNSEELNHLVETSTSVLLNQYFLKAKEILARNAVFLSSVIDKLLEDTVITMEDIQTLRTEIEINAVELG